MSLKIITGDQSYTLYLLHLYYLQNLMYSNKNVKSQDALTIS